MGISTIFLALAISIVAVSNLLPVHAGPAAAAAPTAVRSKRSAFYGGGFDGGLYGGGLYGGGFGGLYGGGLLGGGAVYNHDYPSAYPGSYVGYYDNSPTKMAAQGDSYTNQNYKPYAVRSQAYGSYGSSSSRYKRSAFFGDGLYGGYGGGLYGGGLYGGGLYGGYGGLLGGGAVYNHDYPSAYPGSYVGYYDSSPTKTAALGDSYTNQNYKPYAARLSSY